MFHPLPKWNLFDLNSFVQISHLEAKRMTDEQLAFQAVTDAQRILEEYLEPRPRNNERIILDKLVEVLERPDLLVAINRMQRAS
jgi:phage gp36-like protein